MNPENINEQSTTEALPEAPAFGEYFTKRVLKECKLTPEELVIELLAPEEDSLHGQAVRKAIPYITEDAEGNVVIRPFNLDGELRQRQVKKGFSKGMGSHKVETFELVRLAAPVDDRKYIHPRAFGSMPFIPVPLWRKFQAATPIDTLVLTEGYFKAIRAGQAGIDCIGLSGINLISDKESDKGALYGDILKIIQHCAVKNVIILWDRDCRNISSKALSENKDIRQRPEGFVNAAIKISERLKDLSVDVYFSYVDSKDEKYISAKGLDDLLNAAQEQGKEEEIVDDLLNFNGDREHFRRISMAIGADNKLRNEFFLNNYEAFYKHNQAAIGEMPFVWSKDVYQWDEETEAVELKWVPGLPKGVDVLSFLRYNYYIAAGRYWTIRTGKGPATRTRLTNFTMKVKYHIGDARGTRVVELIHESGRTVQVELDVNSMASVTEFKKKTEALGPYNCTGLTQGDLDNIKESLYAQEKACHSITTLGQQKQGFWAWSNGIYYKGAFYPTNEHGMVEIDENWYYIKYAVEGETEAESYEDERKFQYMETPLTFSQWAKMYVDTYADNGKIALSFGIAAIFVDLIAKQTRQFPILYFFGKKGSGKTTAALSLLRLFGIPRKEFSLEGKGTAKAMGRLMAKERNALVLFDEYKDSQIDAIGVLKGFGDRAGYSRAAMSQDNRTNTVPVLSSAMMAGQHLIAEPALFSRTLYLQFVGDTFEGRTQAYQALMDAEELGLSGVLHELLNLRQVFADEFKGKLKEWYTMLRAAYPTCSERQLKFWGLLLATCDIVGGVKMGDDGVEVCTRIQLPFSIYKEFLPLVESRLAEQGQMMESANEVKQYFEMLAFLIQRKYIHHGNEFKYVIESDTRKLLYVRMGAVHSFYMQAHRETFNRPGLAKDAMMEYCKTDKAFLETKAVVRFPGLNGRATSSYIFDANVIAASYKVNFEDFINLDYTQYVETTEPAY